MGDGVVERMGSQVTVGDVEAVLAADAASALQLIDLACELETKVGNVDLGCRNTDGKVGPLLGRDGLARARVQDVAGLLDDLVDLGLTGPDPCLQRAVSVYGGEGSAVEGRKLQTAPTLDVELVGASGDGRWCVGPAAGVCLGVLEPAGQRTLGNAEVEGGKDELDCWQVQRIVWPQGDKVAALLEAQSILPGHLDVVNLDAARLGASHAQHIDPLIAVDDAWLLAQHGRKHMRLAMVCRTVGANKGALEDAAREVSRLFTKSTARPRLTSHR